MNSNQADDKALLKIVNHGDSTFYLESASFTHHENDVADQAEAGGKLATSTEQMYLVVRSLKHNNEKIVSLTFICTATNQKWLYFNYC